jgi:hypothetical protein
MDIKKNKGSYKLLETRQEIAKDDKEIMHRQLSIKKDDI